MNDFEKLLSAKIERDQNKRKYLKRDPISLDEEMRHEYLSGAQSISQQLVKVVAALDALVKASADNGGGLRVADQALTDLENWVKL